MIGNAPDCLRCKHFAFNPNRFVCKAYPEGIPNLIATGLLDHRQPYPGDNDIRYEPIEQPTQNEARRAG